MRWRWAMTLLVLLVPLGLGLLLGNGCAGDGPQELPPEPPRPEAQAPAGPASERPTPAARPAAVVPASPAAPARAPGLAGEGPAPSSEAPASEATASEATTVTRPPLPPLNASPFRPLSLSGTRGGALAYEIEGTPEEIAAMLLDFEGATGVRPWARAYRTLSTSGDETQAEWQFGGKMGVNPTVVLAFTRAPLPSGGVRIRYRVVRKAFGLSAFFGDWQVEPVTGVPGRSRLAARVYIDSGLPFVNASSEDIEKGLREDAARMRDWMERRLAGEERAR